MSAAAHDGAPPCASHARRCAGLAAALAGGAVSEETPTAMLMDLDLLDATISHIQRGAGYPASALHTVAVKANPVGRLLQLFRDRGMGAEAASLGELRQALHVGFAPERIVFDSPAKTLAELRFALGAGVAVNLDNLQELRRTAELLASEPQLLAAGPGQQLIGLRINPQVGEGSIAATSTGGAVSKFGFPLQELRQQLVDAFVQHPWLNMLHLHVGSQGLSQDVVLRGIKEVWGLLEQVQQACGAGRIKVLDIGGGLTVDFGSDEPPQESEFQLQARLLSAQLPQLFDPACPVRLVTENGRSLFAKAGCTASRVEYTKWSGGRHIAVCHIGADLFMRACYMPATWGLRVFICDASGRPKVAAAAAKVAAGEAGQAAAEAEEVVQDVAGPLCFQGDRLAVGALMPRADVGDYVMVVDTGAYTLSMYSRYNSRCAPPVYGYRSSGGGGSGSDDAAAVSLTRLWAGETVEQVVAFWNM